MRPQAYQTPEIRDENDFIIQQGTFGKKTPFVNSQNDGILDYIINNLEAIKGMSLAATVVVSSLPSVGQAGKFYLLDDGTENSGKVYIYKDKWIEVTTQAEGLSAYQVAKKNGYEGTEQEWLENEVYGDDIVSAETDSDGYFIVHTRQGKTIKTSLKPLVDAKASADKAKISETNAKTSETNSANSAAAALASQEASANSQTKAKTSETNAKTSELNAKASENNAKTSETNAKNSATAAAGSASVATTQAENSSNSATASQKSATASADSASAAHTSEVNASSSASAASVSAGKAKSSETNAKTYETNAKASELNAKASENNAKSSENLAKAWAMSESSPDGVDGNKSAKTWAMSAISAEANAKQSEINANSYKNAAASSATASANSASASSASEINSANSAKASASSAAAAKASEANAKASADRANSSLETLLGGQVNADWAITDNTNKAFIKNKPDLTVYATKEELETECVDKINQLNTALKNGFTTASLTVSGETSVPTPSTENNSKTIANTEFVHGVVSDLVNGAPTALDTLQELASALGNDPNFATTVLNKIGEKESKTDAQIEYKKLQNAIDAQEPSLLTGNNALWNHLHRFGINPTLPTTNVELNKLGVFSSFVTKEGKFTNKPTHYGQLINLPATKDFADATQLWIEQYTGKMWHRGGNVNNNISDTPFTRFLDTDDTKIVTVPITIVDPESIRDVKCLKSGHTVFVTFSALKVKANGAPSKEKALITGLPHSVSMPLTIYAPTRAGSILRGDLTDGWFAWNWTPPWTVSSGDECIFTFTYFTND